MNHPQAIAGNADANGLDPYYADTFALRKALLYTHESPKVAVALKAAEEDLRRWADQHYITILGSFTDLGVSRNAPLSHHRQLCQALALLDYGDADTLIVTDLIRGLPDRRDVRHEAISRIRHAGAYIIERTTNRTFGPTDFDDADQADYLEQQRRRSEDEIRALQRRIKRGRDAKAARRGYLGGHRPHLPWAQELVKIDGKLEYRWIPDRVTIVREIVQFIDGVTLYREHDGYQARNRSDRGFGEMARRLNARGIPARGRKWYPASVRYAYLRGLPLSHDDEIAAFSRARTLSSANAQHTPGVVS